MTGNPAVKYTWHWCSTCKCHYVRCPKCGNNCCNGMYGRLFGKECDECYAAYEYQETHEEERLSQPMPQPGEAKDPFDEFFRVGRQGEET
jgi:hypothetical protein